MRSFALFCALLRSLALFCALLRSLALCCGLASTLFGGLASELLCSHSRSFVRIYVFLRPTALRTTTFGKCCRFKPQQHQGREIRVPVAGPPKLFTRETFTSVNDFAYFSRNIILFQEHHMDHGGRRNLKALQPVPVRRLNSALN